METEKVNLRTLFTAPYEDLPDMVDSLNCIYKITNLLSDKSYVGQAKWFFGRFVGSGFSHRNALAKGDTYLYNAIRKHKSRNFEVEILEKDLAEDDLNDREIYWISYYEAYYKDGGYNMTTGGEHCENLHKPEVYENQRRNHGGVLAFHTQKARDKIAINGWFRQYRLNVNKAIDSFDELTPFNYYKSSSWVHLDFLVENISVLSKDKRWNEDFENLYQGIMELDDIKIRWNLSDKKVLTHNQSLSISRWFNMFQYNLDKCMREYGIINGQSFFACSSWNHLDKIIKEYDILQDDDRWTSEHERIYQELLKIPGMIERYKL